MRICVTGSEGYIGSALCQRLEPDHELLKVDVSAPAPADITEGVVRDKVREFRPWVVFNLAGVSGERACLEDPARSWAVNMHAPVDLWRAVPNVVFVQASSASVLANKGPGTTPYASGKLAAERVFQNFTRTGTYVLRFGTVYGYNPASMRWDTPFNKMVLDAVTKREITVHGPERMRPWVALDSLVDRLEAIVDDAEGGVAHGWEFPLPVVDFNMSLGRVAELIQYGVDREVKIFSPPGGDGDTRDYCMPALDSVPYAWGTRLGRLIKGAENYGAAAV